MMWHEIRRTQKVRKGQGSSSSEDILGVILLLVFVGIALVGALLGFIHVLSVLI